LRSGRKRDDRSGVEVEVRPAVQPLADAFGERIVDRRVAERARDPEAHQPVSSANGFDLALHPDDGVQLQQGQRRRGAGEVYLTRGECVLDRLR